MNKISRIRLGVNIDHVATLRNARGTFYPDPLKMVNMIGIDTSLSILENLNRHNKDTYVPKTLSENVKKGILGFKNKKILKL